MEIKIAEDFDGDSQKKEVTKVTSSVLDAFALIRATKDDDKLSGGAKIIIQVQASEVSKDFNYTLKRLVRSLGANAPENRTGYFATLVTLLNKTTVLTVTQVLELVKKELHASNSSKSEIGDVALGQILVCGAVFRSALILKSTPEEQKDILTVLLSASKKKSYLGTVAYLMLLDFVNKLNEEQFGCIVWSNIKEEFKKDLKEHTLDSLYFLLVVSKKYPNKVKLRKLIGMKEILCEDNIPDICDKLMAGIEYSSLSHPIYNEIGVQLANCPHLIQFWTTGIDTHLVKHNRNRELAALSILTAVFHNMENAEVLPELISNNFFKLFMDWFKGLQTASKIRNKREDEDDHKIMIKKQKELLNALAKTMKLNSVDNNIRVEILKKLLFSPGEMNFTEITGTTLVKLIISDLNKESIKKMAKLFKGVLLNTSKKTIKDGVERMWYNNERLKSAEFISYLVIHEEIKDDTEFKITFMKLLMCFGFFKIGGDGNAAISNDLSGAIKSCFYRCFTSRFSNVDSLVTALSSLCNFITSSLEKEQIRVKKEKQFPKESMECWEMLNNVTDNLEAKQPKSKVDKVFLILLYQLGLFLFSEPTHVKMARSSIMELKSCYAHYSNEKKNLKKIKESDISDDDPEWIEVLVEVLLSILSVDSSVLRSVVQCVFRLLWEFLSPTAIGQIVSVLDPESESNPLTNGNDSDSENSSGNEDSDEEEDSEKKDQSDESDSNMEEEGDVDDDEMKIPEQLKMAVQKALGATAAESDAESIDAEMIDEEEGNKIDEALAEAFRQFGQGKGKKSKKDRKDKKTLSDFRIRVLDLIDIYLEKDCSMDICLAMIAPLMRCLEFCIQDNQFKELENRLRKTIKLLTKVRKFTSTEGITINILGDYLKSTIDKGSRSHFLFQAVGDVITFFATFIIHCSQKIEHINNKTCPLVQILKESLHSYFHNRNCLLPIIFFHSLLQTDWKGTYALVPIVIENVFNSNVRQYRRNEGLELLVGYYRALKRNKPTDKATIAKLSKLESLFETTLTNTLEIGSNFEIKNNFIVVLKKLINNIKMFHESCNVNSNLNYQALLDVVGSYKVTIKSSNNSNHPKELQNKKIKSKKNRKKKRKSEQINGHSEPQKKRFRKESAESVK